MENSQQKLEGYDFFLDLAKQVALHSALVVREQESLALFFQFRKE